MDQALWVEKMIKQFNKLFDQRKREAVEGEPSSKRPATDVATSSLRLATSARIWVTSQVIVLYYNKSTKPTISSKSEPTSREAYKAAT
ncbi:hypothetical protein ACLOJK_026460 [Asimina triloba]